MAGQSAETTKGGWPAGRLAAGSHGPSGDLTPPPAPVGGRDHLGSSCDRAIVANESWTLLALIIFMVYFTAAAPGKFLTLTDLSYIAKNASPLLMMAVGETFVILTAGIDLSVGAVLVLSGVVAGEYYQHQPGSGANAGWGVIVVGAVIGLATGLAFGAVRRGSLVTKAKIPPLIATLAGLGIATGISYLVTGGSDLRIIPARLANTIGNGDVAGCAVADRHRLRHRHRRRA